MSEESVIIMFGLKFRVGEDEIESLKCRKHPYQIRASEFRLDSFWVSFSAFDEEYHLFIGKKIAVMGCEHDWSCDFEGSELLRTFEDTRARLTKAGFEQEPKLLMQLRPDL
jgi:hypothetical protein